MAEKKDPPPEETEHIQRPRVRVGVRPKDQRDVEQRRTGKKIAEKITKDVQDAINDNKKGGVKKQIEKVNEVVDDVKKRAPRTVEEVKVEVEGETPKGDTVEFTRKVKPDSKES